MITEDYVSFETAKLLKEKGFNWPTYRAYCETNREHQLSYDVGRTNSQWDKFNKEDGIFNCSAPTFQMAMKWLRKEHQIGIFPRQYHIYKDNAVSDEFGYGVEIIKLGTDIPLNPNGEKISDKDRYFISTSYEEACEAGIKYCLENLI